MKKKNIWKGMLHYCWGSYFYLLVSARSGNSVYLACYFKSILNNASTHKYILQGFSAWISCLVCLKCILIKINPTRDSEANHSTAFITVA